MTSWRKHLDTATFVATCLPVLAAPWFFGAWEMWWFWPFAVCVFVAALICGVKLLLPAGVAAEAAWPGKPPRRLAVACLPFLLYAAVRFAQSPVFMDAERSFLLYLTPFLLALVIFFGLEAGQRRLLFWLLVVNVLLLGLYGLINHAWTGSERVMWKAGFAQYYEADRASGSYYCPDHYAGVLEIGICLALGLLIRGPRGWRATLAAAALIVVGIAGILLSKSRGAGLTLIVVGAAAMIWGVAHLPRAARWWWRLCACALGLLLIAGVAEFAHGYTERFGSYFMVGRTGDKPWREALADVAADVRKRGRAHSFSAAWRSWKTAPWAGIGPGMHLPLWPHFAASPDGDRRLKRWPTFPNHHFVANTVHNDWLQLLQEYGVIGFTLFALPAGGVLLVLRRRVVSAPDAYLFASDARLWPPALALGALLTLVAMAFHSLGDFNLQMPATTWIVAAVIGLALCADRDAEALDA